MSFILRFGNLLLHDDILPHHGQVIVALSRIDPMASYTFSMRTSLAHKIRFPGFNDEQHSPAISPQSIHAAFSLR
jgi:hypothetical protein